MPKSIPDIPENDKTVLRQLASEKFAIGQLPVQKEKADLWCKLNMLDPTRPMVWINEIPWCEFALKESLQTTHLFCRDLELTLRMELYQWHHFPADMVVTPVIYCPLVIHNTGFGIQQDIQRTTSSDHQLAADTEGERRPQTLSTEPIYSKHFEPQIQNEKDIEKIQFPHVTFDEHQTELNFAAMQDIFGNVIPVQKRPVPGFWFAPWDDLITWWGVQEALTDLVLRPDLVKAAMARLVQAHLHRLEQHEALNLLALNNDNTRVGSGGYGCTSELPPQTHDPSHLKTQDLWGCATAQIFSNVSPAMHEEFALDFELQWLQQFGLNYYGCCEPLHLKIPILRRIPNLRKISISPWADIAHAAEQMQNRYVISYKPSPAIFAAETWDPNQARRQLIADLDKTRPCPVEIIMKDISTVRCQPQRLSEWAQIAREVTEQFRP